VIYWFLHVTLVAIMPRIEPENVKIIDRVTIILKESDLHIRCLVEVGFITIQNNN